MVSSPTVTALLGEWNRGEAAQRARQSPSTVKRDWRVARAWLYRELVAGSQP